MTATTQVPPAVAPEPAQGFGATAVCGCPRIPPLGVDLEFVRVRDRPHRPGKVHVLTWHDLSICTGLRAARRNAVPPPEAVTIVWVPVQCGSSIQIREGDPDDKPRSRYTREFVEQELCTGCAQRLGEHASRAYESRLRRDDCTACGGLRDECEHARRRCCASCHHTTQAAT